MSEHLLFGDPNGNYAKVIADSVSPTGSRLTTMEIQFWRPMLPEFNTHRAFSRNSASSRAIPVEKQIERIEAHLAGPVVWASEQRGMQGGDELNEGGQINADWMWGIAARHALDCATELSEMGVHKSVVSRLLEPFMWHRVIVSSTEWDNFFAQRCSPLAQPEIRVVAEHMQIALSYSDPSFVDYGEWHLPYVGDDPEILDDLAGKADAPAPWMSAAQVSAARSARVSYLTHDGQRDVAKDLDLFVKLRTAQPEPHWSPMEHPASPVSEFDPPESRLGNFDGWIQLRHHPLNKEISA